MELYSLSFVLLVTVGLVLYYTVLRRCQWLCLLAISLVFFAASGWQGIFFLFFTALTVWGGGLWLARLDADCAARRKAPGITKDEKKAVKAKTQRHKKCVVALGLVMPLGISFYTFQAIGYLIDCFRGRHPAEKNPARFLLFISFFPQLIQGPINRYGAMEPQLTAAHSWEWERTKRALFVILFGAMKKYAIANLTAPTIAAILDRNDPTLAGSMALLAILLYSLQQYADFSGGIDMVLGVAQLFGIEMMPNFRQPYFSTSLGDFWRRWHISLGAWMRDYLFYPFALTKPMQRFGKWATGHWGKHFGRVLPAAVANLLVFAVVGIWHGPQAHYLVWGLYNGMVIALADLLEPAFKKMNTALHIPTESRTWHIFRILRTFVIVNIGWYFDRVGLSLGAAYLRNTFVSFRPEALTAEAPAAFAAVTGPAWGIVAISTVLVFVHSLIAELGREPYTEVQRLPLALRWGLYYLVMFLVTLSFICVTETSGFLYANF